MKLWFFYMSHVKRRGVIKSKSEKRGGVNMWRHRISAVSNGVSIVPASSISEEKKKKTAATQPSVFCKYRNGAGVAAHYQRRIKLALAAYLRMYQPRAGSALLALTNSNI